MTLIPVNTKDLTNQIAKRVRNRIRTPGKAADENQDETRRPERRKTVSSFDASSCLAVGFMCRF